MQCSKLSHLFDAYARKLSALRSKTTHHNVMSDESMEWENMICDIQMKHVARGVQYLVVSEPAPLRPFFQGDVSRSRNPRKSCHRCVQRMNQSLALKVMTKDAMLDRYLLPIHRSNAHMPAADARFLENANRLHSGQCSLHTFQAFAGAAWSNPRRNVHWLALQNAQDVL
jgi:hypothetical protein